MPVWGWITLAVALVFVAAAAGVGGFFAWRAYVRRTLMRLVVKRAAVEAVGQALEEVTARLAEAPDEELELFARDIESSERRALHEVVSRAAILRDELDHVPLPKDLVPLATKLADAAHVITVQAGGVTDEMVGDDALVGLSAIDLQAMRAYMEQARNAVTLACASYGLEDTNVYGGGLYL